MWSHQDHEHTNRLGECAYPDVPPETMMDVVSSVLLIPIRRRRRKRATWHLRASHRPRSTSGCRRNAADTLVHLAGWRVDICLLGSCSRPPASESPWYVYLFQYFLTAMMNAAFLVLRLTSVDENNKKL